MIFSVRSSAATQMKEKVDVLRPNLMSRAEQVLLGDFCVSDSTFPSSLHPLRNPVLFLTFLLWSSLIWAGVLLSSAPMTLEVMRKRMSRFCRTPCTLGFVLSDVGEWCSVGVVSPLGHSVWWWPELQTHVQLFFIWSTPSPRTWVWWCADTCASWVAQPAVLFTYCCLSVHRCVWFSERVECCAIPVWMVCWRSSRAGWNMLLE